MALSKVKGTLERVLDKNLQDLVRGIRNHKENENKYVAECLDEIKQELRQENIAVKAMAVNKLTYLQMLGYDISWAAFNIIEVMSSSKFTFKRIGYLAASQCFHEGTDVLMLTTNMIRKDLSAQGQYDAGVALNGLSCFITPDLARDLANDIMTLMTSTKPYLRKKAVLIMYKVFLQFPEALRPAFPRLKEKLEDPDPGVQSAAVNVICELARKNPRNYLSLAPLFFKLMTSSTNNWVLIKIIKLFGALTPLEPRLGKKLIEPLTNLIHSTSAMSLLYECINTVIAGIPNHSASIQLCVQKLRILIEDSDQNLKYLGLLAMSKILQTHPKSVQTHKDLILQCLDDKDESIRFRALDLLYGMVSKKNLMEIVKKLMIHMDKAEGTNYRDELLAKIIEICSQSNYQYVTNFEWYVSVLVELTRMEGTRHGRLIAAQMLDVAIRVQAIRSFAVAQMAVLLENSHLLASNSQRNGICEVLYAAAWLCGEFPDELGDPKSVLDAMLKPKITALPGHIQSVYVQNIVKIYANIIKRAEEAGDTEVVKEVGEILQEKLPMFIQSSDLEVQERACCMVQLVKYVLKLHDKGATLSGIAEEITTLFAGELNPVAAKAQKKVPVPEGLDLDSWINEPPSDSSDDDSRRAGTSIFVPPAVDDHKSFYPSEPSRKVKELTEEEREKAREQRRLEQEHNPNYLKGDVKRKRSSGISAVAGEAGVEEIKLDVPLHVPGLISSDKYLKIEREGGKKKQKKKKKRRKKGAEESDEEDIPQQHQVSTVVEMPEGANAASDQEDTGGDELYKRLDVNLEAPLQPNEILPVRTHRVVSDQLPAPVEETEKKKSKHRKDKDKKEKKKRREEREEGKEKKKHKKKSNKAEAETVENEPSVMMEDHEVIEGDNTPLQSPRDAVPAVNSVEEEPSENKMNDYDFWLSGSDAKVPEKTEVTPAEEPAKVKVSYVPELSSEEEEVKSHSKKKKKEKREKKDRREKKKSKNKLTADGYEEAGGITTPSKEDVSSLQLETPVTAKPMSSYRLLAENSSIKLTYETRVNPQRTDQIILSVVFTNLTLYEIKSLEFNVMDTLNTKLERGMGQSVHDAVQVPFVLPAGVSNEGQFAFFVESIVQPTKMKGTLTYMVKMEDGSTHDKVDFRVEFTCSAFLVALPCKGPDFASFLGSGDLTEKSTMKCTPIESTLDACLLRICFYNHFKVVEKVDNSASLYSRSIQGHHLCLLVKYNEGQLTVDGKSADDALLSNVLSDIKTTLTTENL